MNDCRIWESLSDLRSRRGPGLARLQCRAFPPTDGDRLLGVGWGQVVRARKASAFSDVCEILKLAPSPTCSSLPRDFTLITRTVRCLRQLPSCVAVYSHD